MINQWYISSREGEKWRDVSKLFGQWLEINSTVRSFGFSEGDEITHQGLMLLCFKFPGKHGPNIELFPEWAATTGRIFGGAHRGVVQLSNGDSFNLPSEPENTIPPWLK